MILANRSLGAAVNGSAVRLRYRTQNETGADVHSEKLVEIHSPIVGTFYRSPSPDAPPFVEPGDRVKKGQVICIVEAMKLMNDIECEAAGEVVEILIANGQPVEYGEILFRIRPSA